MNTEEENVNDNVSDNVNDNVNENVSDNVNENVNDNDVNDNHHYCNIDEENTQGDTCHPGSTWELEDTSIDMLNDAIHVVQELFSRYGTNPYMQTRTYNYVCYQLPNILENIQKDHEYRIQRMEDLSNEQQQFIHSFMSNNQYFYLHAVERFFHYDGIHYKIINEDDILYHILSSIRRDRNLLCWKQRTKQHIMRKIKENNLLKSVPESETIQIVLDALYPTFFETKAEAKYFLCVLGDNILKKNNHLIHFIDSQSKHFIRELNNICQTVIGVQLNATLKHKYYEHDYANCRIVHIHETSRIDSVWIPILQTHALDIICVACHYSMRYNSSDEYLTSSCNDMELVNRIFYLKNIQQDELVSLYVNEYLEVHRYRRPSGEMNELFVNTNAYANDAKITWKDMQYLWKQFLDSKKLPSIIFQQTLKGLLIQQLKDYYRESEDSFVGISCKHLPSVKKFMMFWENTIQIDETGNHDDFEYEVNEILYLYKKWCGNSHANKQFTEQQVLDVITYFYPEIEIDKNKYIYRIQCSLWDKQEDVQMGLDCFKGVMQEKYAALPAIPMTRSHSHLSLMMDGSGSNMVDRDISVYEAYVFYCDFAKNLHNNHEQVVSKSYFEKCVAELMDEYLVNDGKNISAKWVGEV